MSLVPGSLLAGMQKLTGEGHAIGVVVVDEQSQLGGGGFAETTAQQRLLAFANNMNYPVWLVELNPNPANANLPTHTKLRGLLPPGTPVVTKQSLNAFSGTNLHALLQAANIDAFVLMGYNVNCCVKHTAVGGFTNPANKMVKPGATQRGYMVLTCQAVLRGGVATWWQEPGVRFYASL